MTLYFFDFRNNGTSTSDPEGTELHGLAEAKQEALASLCEMAAEICHDAKTDFVSPSVVTMDVRLESGPPLFTASISIEISDPS